MMSRFLNPRMESRSASSGLEGTLQCIVTQHSCSGRSLSSALAVAATSTAPVAYVYVSTSKGINLYDVRVPHIGAINTMGVADGSY